MAERKDKEDYTTSADNEMYYIALSFTIVPLFAPCLIWEMLLDGHKVTRSNWWQFNQIEVLVKQICTRSVNIMHKKCEQHAQEMQMVNNNTMTVKCQMIPIWWYKTNKPIHVSKSDQGSKWINPMTTMNTLDQLVCG